MPLVSLRAGAARLLVVQLLLARLDRHSWQVSRSVVSSYGIGSTIRTPGVRISRISLAHLAVTLVAARSSKSPFRLLFRPFRPPLAIYIFAVVQ